MTQASFPNCTSIGYAAFYGCSLLTQVSFPKCTNIGSVAFGYCSALISLYLTQVTSVPTIGGSGVFDGTPLIVGGSGKIYVPSSLVTAFQTAQYWSGRNFVGV